MKMFDIPTAQQVNDAVTTLTGGMYYATDLLPIIREMYQFIAEMKLQYEDDCPGSPQDAAKCLFALRLMSHTIENAKE